MEVKSPTFSDDWLPYSIGGRCINGDWFGMPVKEVWEILTEQLFFAAHGYGLRIHAFVLMSNHFHLLASAPPSVLSSAMQYLLVQSSRIITKSTGRINHTWCSRFFRCQILTDRYYLHAYKYFYRNPVEAGICKSVEEYPFSTLHGLIGSSRLIVPMQHDDTLFSDFEGTLKGLNHKPDLENREAVRKALRRRKFKLPRHGGSFHPLEKALY